MEDDYDAGKDAAEEEVIDGGGRCYRVTWEKGIGLRKSANVFSDRVGIDLLKGEIFEVKTEVRRGGRRYFELLDGRGWAFDWTEIDGQKVELVELAAQLYTVYFPDGVQGIEWGSEYLMRYTQVKGFTDDSFEVALAPSGIRPGDTLVMINQDPVIGMPFGQVLERIWATRGAQPGSGVYYRVITESPYGIGIRQEPDIDSQRIGEDLIRGSIFEVDEEWTNDKDGITYLRLADGRGWVFDYSKVDPEQPTVENLRTASTASTLTFWRGKVDELTQTLGLKFREDGSGTPCTLTVYEDDLGPQYVTTKTGSNLREVLLANGFEVYQDMGKLFNCSANNLCGTCVLQVLDGNDNLTAQSVNEQRAMKLNPESYRLCCGIDIYGDTVVRLRPADVKNYGGTS